MNIPERIAKIYLKKLHTYTQSDIEYEKAFFNKLFLEGVPENTILIIEPNDCHSECLPSYVKYFTDLNFNVDLFISKKNFEENAFVNCNFNTDKFRIFWFKRPFTQPIFYEFLNNYKYILLTSLTYLDTLDCFYQYYAKYLIENYLKKYNKNNLYVLSHEVDYNNNMAEVEEFFLNKTFVLRPNIYKDKMSKSFPFITPSYFGNFDIQHNKKNNNAKFLCIGGTYKKNLRNFDILLDTVKKLSKNYANKFEIIYIGNPDNEFRKRTEKENINIKFTGRISFDEMYKYILTSDFILFNIDKNSVEYERYLTKKISGSYSLTLGFLCPGIVDEKLACAYNLKGGSITYSDENLYDAMEKAIKMNNTEYQKLVDYLKQLNKSLQELSIKNIKECFYA